MTELKELGWRKSLAKQLNAHTGELRPARVARQDVGRYQLLSEAGPLIGVLPGKTRLEAGSRADLPAVGDWVLCRPADAADPTQVIIEQTLVRFSKFSRKVAGDRFEEQVVAANIDTVFIVSGLDDNFNVGRIERYLMLAWHSGATPVIVLNKADLCTDLDDKLIALAPVALGTPIICVSAATGQGLERLGAYVTSGNTVALLGSSGVGKSTITNCLLGDNRFETGEVREFDSKGRHTTTFRELCVVPGGGLLIDTPGMREIQLWADDASLAGSFADVESLAEHCKFRDCGHAGEPGCAVQAAIDEGRLEADRLTSYHKLQREVTHFAEQQDIRLRAERKLANKKFSRMIRNLPSKRDGGTRRPK
ncbi:MAG: ribosome small subunit-dependent GTPase A [Pseudomonadota bacterium]